MKKISLFVFIAFFLASVVSTTPQGFVHAQDPECHDAAGGVIPCPPTEEIPCGQPGGPECAPAKEQNTPTPIIPVFTPTATATSLSIANPAGDAELAGSEWSGSCALTDLKCPLAFSNGCEHVGGSWEVVSTSETEVTLKCTVPLVIESTPMPLTSSGNGATEGKKKDDWSIDCPKGNAALDSSAQLSCVLAVTAQCSAEGGSTTGSEDANGNINLNCVHLEIEPTPLPLSSVDTATPRPEEGYLGQCTKADGDFFECKEKFTCEDGLLVMKVDLYSGNGTVYDFYCYPQKPNLSIAAVPGNNATENWTGDCNSYNSHGNLSACLDEYAAACAQEGGDYSEWYDDDGSAGVYCQNESEASQSVPVETALPATIPADSGPTPPSGGLPWLWLTIGGIGGALLLPAVQKVREAAARSRGSSPLTREHILLNKDNNGTKTGFVKPDEPSTAQYKLKDVMVSSIKSNEQDPKQEDPESNN